jgi:acyl-ACP thioesterase
LSDVTTTNRMRLDAIARGLQDVAMADVVAAGVAEPAWVVRRTLVVVDRYPRFRERLELATYCWSLGRFAAERRTTMRGEHGGALDSLTLWVRLDPATGRPAELTPAFRALYAEAIAGRRTDHELHHDPSVPAAPGEPWPLRACDFDLHGHVNNAAYWAAVEEELAAQPAAGVPHVFEMEFRAALAPGAQVTRARRPCVPPTALSLGLVAGARLCASALAWSDPRAREHKNTR